jgi:hypothetical protein
MHHFKHLTLLSAWLVSSTLFAAPTFLLLNIDQTRSNLTWDLAFQLGTVNIPVTPSAPGSLTSSVDGWISTNFDRAAETLVSGIGGGTAFQPDVNSYAPGSASGLLSSVAGSFNALGLINGALSVRGVTVLTSFSISGFAPDTLPVGGPLVPLGPFNLETSFAGAIDYSATGLITASGTQSIGLPFGSGFVNAQYRRTAPHSLEMTLDINRPVLIGSFNLGGVPINGTLNLTGPIVLTGDFVPEASPFTLMSVLSLGVGLAASLFSLKAKRS